MTNLSDEGFPQDFGDAPPESNFQENSDDEYFPHRVFINRVDTFSAKYIAAYITDQYYAASRLSKGDGGEEAAAGEDEEAPEVTLLTNKYEVVGALSSPYSTATEDILYTISEEDEGNFKEEIMKCGVVVFDITKNAGEIDKALKMLEVLGQEFERIQTIGPKTYEKYGRKKIFILISTIMTWGLTKPLDRDDPDLPFSEVDYKKRRPHPNYKQHLECEKQVIKMGQKFKDKLKTYVVGSGVVYGEEEQDLEFYFKTAWYNEVIPIFGSGNNRIPFIHVRDLSKVLHGLMELAPPKPQYILAVEQTPSTLKQVIKALSKCLGPGVTTNVTKEEALLYTNMTQQLFDVSTVNLTMEPVFIVENLQIEWKNEANLTENMMEIVTEFRKTRKLIPVKIVLHGPPGVGKSTLAKKLCEYYGSHFVSVPTVMDEVLRELKESVAREKARIAEGKGKEEDEEAEEDDEEAEEEENNLESTIEQIREIERVLERTPSQIPDDFAIGILRNFLAKNICQNRGYVLDDYPKTIPQVKELFGHAGAEEEEEAPVPGGDLGKILPDLVISLQAPDDFLCKKVMQLQEDQIKGTIYEENTFLKRLEEFRNNNNEDNTVLNYFDELEILLQLIDVTKDESADLSATFDSIVAKLGEPTGFGLSVEELEELNRLEEIEKKLTKEREELEQKMALENAEREHKDKMESWVETLEKLQFEEEKILVAESEPLRHYLTRFIFPTLTKGLVELARLKPEDPVDFLAEYLFRENPEGVMFDPSYTQYGEDLYEEFRREIGAIIQDRDEFGR